ncbi:MAG: GTP 3',8-cyclase MoaA [Proteobacteria bacterium]|nr:GTP 3',8-cyclase MoaA [Pseudomonadota bacterium]MBU1649448.1 GTP 3',8-cyclase MoaA [Pseudomonadota bacterium]MBU1986770.1 GTP 3',8-cyclase MoaA [Pseudomonadota bacterium]
MDSSKENRNREQLVDQYSRTISYLRLSITDRCNLRCLYCMPSSSLVKCTDLLSFEELLRIVGIAVGMGMNKLRLTGGEPLVRKGVMDFIRNLAGIKGLEDIRLTTNGVLLHEKAAELYGAGIRNLNISLDSMKRERFRAITGADLFDQVWQGIQTACDLGFNVKLNVVAMKGINDDEFADFARLATQRPIQVRFIEFMPIGNKDSWDKTRFIAADELKEMISTMGTLEPSPGSRLEGPARVYRLTTSDGQTGRIGFISPISHHFCDKCNRLRLTSEGRLRACLLHNHETDLKTLLRQGGTDSEIQKAIQQTILNKPKGHTLQDDLAGPDQVNCQGQMSRIGG